MAVLSTYVSTLVVDKLGRKILLLYSVIAMGICTFLIGGFFYAKDSNYDVSSIAFIPLLSLCVFIILFSIGFGPIDRRIRDGERVQLICKVVGHCSHLCNFLSTCTSGWRGPRTRLVGLVTTLSGQRRKDRDNRGSNGWWWRRAVVGAYWWLTVTTDDTEQVKRDLELWNRQCPRKSATLPI